VETRSSTARSDYVCSSVSRWRGGVSTDESQPASFPWDKKVHFVAFGGGRSRTYDIGLSRSPARLERGPDMVFVCYRQPPRTLTNKGYQARVRHAHRALGDDLPRSARQPGQAGAPHGPHCDHRRSRLVPYADQASISHLHGPHTRPRRTFAQIDGPASSTYSLRCALAVGAIPHRTSIEFAKLAVQTGFWRCTRDEDCAWRLTRLG
jgi:hypothetical protein